MSKDTKPHPDPFKQGAWDSVEQAKHNKLIASENADKLKTIEAIRDADFDQIVSWFTEHDLIGPTNAINSEKELWLISEALAGRFKL